MTNPWGALDKATGEKQLYLDKNAFPAVKSTFEDYETSLQTLINDALDDTSGYGTNDLAVIVQKAFNSRGSALTAYLKEQLSQTQDLKKTAEDATNAIQHEGD
ncbi:hypothetical protein [Mycobacterium sp. 3519A]|jgi:hypothetical protein|uniref:hypothetical protein n=1 Tax=Mycobacterium sp. 3519A TaxID=2057184 RepID=UPI000C7C3282|nr:hypothetical protein [Mycobacterium sp. 3519A]